MGANKKKSIWLAWLFISLFVFYCLSGAQKTLADRFDGGQKKEIEKIIRDYLLQNPHLLREVIVELDKKEKAEAQAAQKAAIAQHAKWIFSSPNDFVAGNKKGDITLVEFFDYNCGYCKRAITELLQVVKKDPKLRLVLKEMPILGPDSIFAARAALASKKQGKYWEYHLALLQNQAPNNQANVLRVAKEVGLDIKKLQADMETPDILKQLADIEQKSIALGIRSTPAFILDDQLFPGALPQNILVQLISELRKRGGCTLC